MPYVLTMEIYDGILIALLVILTILFFNLNTDDLSRGVKKLCQRQITNILSQE